MAAFTPVPVTLTAAQKAVASGTPVAADKFGINSAISGDGLVLVVGASDQDTGGTSRGSVYTYDWTGVAWRTNGSVLQAFDAANSDQFGISVSLSDDGTVLVVGAYAWEGTTDQGAVYTYYRSGAPGSYAWTPVTAYNATPLTAGDAAASDFFGSGVSLSGDGLVLAVGAYAWEGSLGDQGAVYIYDRSGTGASITWALRGGGSAPQITASDAAASDNFGRSVALDYTGATICVGAPSWEGTNTNQGAAYVLTWNGFVWGQKGAVLFAADNQASQSFGDGVAISGDGLTVAVGAPNWDSTYADQGRILLYDWVAASNAWVIRGTSITAASPAASAFFGYPTLTPSGGLMVIGSSGATDTISTQGVVFLYALQSGALPGAFGGVTQPLTTTSGYGGTPVALVGDLTTPASVVTGSGSAAYIGTGDVTSPRGAVEGVAFLGSRAVGSLVSSLPIVLGEGGEFSASISVPCAEVSASGVIGLIGAASLVTPSASLSVTATVAVVGTGDVRTLPPTISGESMLGKVGASAILSPNVTCSGTAFVGVVAEGAVVVSSVEVVGSAWVVFTGAGRIQMPRIYAQGESL